MPHKITSTDSAGLGGKTRASLDLLGLDVEILRSGEERPPITPLLLRALHDHSRGRLADGDAIAALKALEADQADFIAQYGIGYLSATYADALAREAKRAFSGLRLGEALILPALDDQGAIVDILVIHSYVGGHILPSLFSEPRGILAPHLAAGCSELWITDTFRWLARMMRQGLRDTLLLRGPADAVNNAKRLASMGVRRIHGFLRRDADAIAAALHAAGIEIGTISRQGPGDESQAIEVRPHPAGAKSATASLSSAQALPPMPPVPVPNSSAPDATGIESALRQVQLDAPNEWHFEVGALRISIDRRTDGESTRDIVLRANQKVAQDRFDLAIDVQRQRFASGAALKIGLPESILLVHLSDLLAAVQRIESEQASGPAVVVSTAERSEAETLLRASDLTNRIAADLTAMGWIGDDDTKILLYLTGVSRLLPRPLWALYQASGGAAPWRELGLIASLTPPEFRLVLPRVSESLLLHAQARRRSLAHHLLLIDQAETLRPEPALALRVLSERGGIGWATLDPAAMGADLVAEARGPVSVLAAASGDIDRRCRDCFLSLQCDESPEQTAKILAAQRVGTTGLPILGILARHHALQRLLRPATVQIPFRDRIMFPNARVRHRADHARFLVLIAASALLHQAQRTRDHDAIVADEADFRLAARLASQFVAASDAGLSSQASLFLQRLPAATESFTTATVPGLFPEWTRWTSRAVLQELVDGGYLAANGGGRGKERRFQLRRRSQLAQRDQIGLRAVGTIVSEVGGLAEVGGSDSANVSPCGSVG